MEMICERSKESVYSWNKTAEKSDFEAVEALMSMSCSWKSDFKKYIENRPVTPVSDTSEEENLLPGTPDFHTAIPAFVSIVVSKMNVNDNASYSLYHGLDRSSRCCLFLFSIVFDSTLQSL